MKKKTFDIANIASHEDLNALSIALNAKEQVSHIKIGKNNITFNCIDIEPLMKLIHSIDQQLVVKEVVDGVKREYDLNKPRDKKYYFMFKNLINEDDILNLVKKIKEDHRFKDVDYNKANRVLFLTTDEKKVLKKIKSMMASINPSIIVYEHFRPVRSQDVFQKKFLMNYLKIGFLLVTIALALVTSKDKTTITPLFWIISILLLGERNTISALKNIKDKKFFHEDVLVTLGMILGVLGGHPIESCITMVLYLLFEPFRILLLERCFAKVNEAISMPEVGMREKDGIIEKISLYDFQVDDIMVVAVNERISIPGYIVEGHSSMDTYASTGSYDLRLVDVGDKVNSGDINIGEQLKIKITKNYESGNFANIMNIASIAPMHQSKIEALIQKFSDMFTPIVVVIAIIAGVVLPILDYDAYSYYIGVGAVLFLVSGSFAYEQSSSINMLSCFAKAFQQGIYIESAKGLDAINEAQVIVYDTIDNSELSVEEFDLLKRLSRLGRTLIIFNDTSKSLENDQYKIYNHISIEEKLDIIDNAIGPVIYIGDSTKDIECFQNSYVAISRGGIKDSKVVANSDIVLVDSAFNRLIEVFSIANKMRLNSLINLLISIILKLIIVILAVSPFITIPLWLTLIYEAIAIMIVLYNATRILD